MRIPSEYSKFSGPGRGRAIPRLLIGIGICFLALLVIGAEATDYQPGEAYFGRNDYIEYRAGNLPVILTAGHGGHLRPDEIPDRTWGVTVTDLNTRQLTEKIAAEITERTGKYPHVVICHLRRTKLDANREILEAAQENEFAEQAWHEYHDFIETARATAKADFGFGFLADIHGHGHEIQRIELGYHLGNVELNRTDTELEAPGFGWNSSLRTLMLRRPGVPFPELLRGSASLGDRLNDRGIPSWPSSDHPAPGDAPFFRGGFTIRAHTSFIDNSSVNGVQVEANFEGMRDTVSNRRSFAANFARVMQPYLYENYGYSVGTLPLYTLQTDAVELEKGGSPVEFQVIREGYKNFSSTMDIDFGGTATRGEDFLATNTSIRFSSGQTAATFSLLPLSPNEDSGDKTIEVRLAPRFRQTADTSALVLPLGDGTSQSVRLEAKTPEVFESDGEGFFRLRRTSEEGELTVNVDWDGTAVPGRHYDFARDLPESVRFPAGVTEKDIAINLVNDAIPEPDKEIVLRVLPGEGYEPGYPSVATVQLIDDDAPHGIMVWLRGEVDGNLLLDSSGNEHHATALPAGRGPASVSTSNGQAIAFDGEEATAALPKVTFDSPEGFSIAFHFRIDPSVSTGGHNLVSFGSRGTAGSINIFLSSSSTLRSWLGSASASSLDAVTEWTDGEWRHYAVTVDAHGIKRVYIDGQQVRFSSGWVPPLDPDEILWLGWKPGEADTDGFFGGAMRDFRVYSRPLVPSEVGAMASGELTFDAWRHKHGLPAEASPLADLDGDGLPLLLEYALGAAPSSPGRPPRHESRIENGRLVLHFLKQTSTRDLTWRVQATDNPAGPWETLAERPAQTGDWALTPEIGLQDENGLISVTDFENIYDSPRRLMRLQLELAD